MIRYIVRATQLNKEDDTTCGQKQNKIRIDLFYINIEVVNISCSRIHSIFSPQHHQTDIIW